VIQPIDSTVYEASQIQEAFRFMANGKHIGKILLKMRETETETLEMKTVSRVHFSQEESVVVVGGLGGFGMELAGWLVARGCRKLVLCSRSGKTNEYQAMRIRLLNNSLNFQLKLLLKIIF
jgi:fatty acid synthase, animal type